MEKLHFKTSSGIKNILGKDLITDRFIAIFELVKNSYDANASRVDVIFNCNDNNAEIKVIDDGTGMSKDDLINKWLFLAFSEKKEGAENTKSRTFVGSKGVGRLSCDSLGDGLIIRTKKKYEENIHHLCVDWKNFEKSLDQKFEDIEISYKEEPALDNVERGFTELYISGLRHNWDEEDIRKAKDRLKRLKNPFIENDGFNIYCKSDERQEDSKSLVKNNISEVLQGKTISLSATISDKISISLVDRGKLIFSISKDNDTLLKNIGMKISINYLTPTAKNNFKRQMGVHAVNYGNIFIYKNGFRVNPYGEMNYDLFNLNVRKNQGYNRYIGTREMLGYIAIEDKNNFFQETSSRNNGFINNIYMASLEDFYINEIHRPFEKYVGLVKWGEDYKTKEETYFDDINLTSEADNFKKSLTKKNNYTIDYFSDGLQFEDNSPRKQLNSVLDKLPDSNERQIIKSVASKLHDLNNESVKKTNLLLKKESEIKQLKQQNANLTALRTRESYAEQVSHHFTKISDSLSYGIDDLISLKKIINGSVELSLLSSAIQIISSTTLEINLFRKVLLKSDMDIRSSQTINLFRTVDWYFSDRMERNAKFKITNIISSEGYIDNWQVYCNTLDFIMLLENFYKNAKEHKADFIEFRFSDRVISVVNNSTPIDQSIFDDIFELGFSTKENGTGVGMYQIKEFCKRYNFDISVENNNGNVIFNLLKGEL